MLYSIGMTRYKPSEVEIAFRSHCRIFERIWVNGDSEAVFDSSDKQRFACKAGEKIARKIGSVDVESYNFVVWDARLNCDAIEEHPLSWLEQKWLIFPRDPIKGYW